MVTPLAALVTVTSALKRVAPTASPTAVGAGMDTLPLTLTTMDAAPAAVGLGALGVPATLTTLMFALPLAVGAGAVGVPLAATMTVAAPLPVGDGAVGVPLALTPASRKTAAAESGEVALDTPTLTEPEPVTSRSP